MSESDRQALFAAWAASYDADVAAATAFPFAGYDAVLDGVVAAAELAPGLAVLELGVGTGNLTQRLVAHTPALDLTGVDFAEEMIAQARQKVSQATFLSLDVLAPTWPALVGRRFARVVATYVLHEFPLATVVAILERLRRDHALPGWRVVIGDIAFPSTQTRADARAFWGDVWDPDEHYFAADEARAVFERAGFRVHYQQRSSCAQFCCTVRSLAPVGGTPASSES